MTAAGELKREPSTLRPGALARDPHAIALLTAGKDPDYALGLTNALASRGIAFELIADDFMARSAPVRQGQVVVRNLLGAEQAGPAGKALRLLRYYLALIRWARRTPCRIFHILWYRKFLLFERHTLNWYFKALGKRLVLTAHNVDDRARDGSSSRLNRFSLRRMYRSFDHLLVHTAKMKQQLVDDFGVSEAKVSVVPHGINDHIPEAGISRSEARSRLGLGRDERVLLFFGNIAPYKGVELLADAFIRLAASPLYRLVVAGPVKEKNLQSYWDQVAGRIEEAGLSERTRLDVGFIPDEEVEAYFKSADVSVLPYRGIFQSGVMILSYRFGTPVIATDVGSLRQDIVEGRTGFLCRPDDADDLARTIESFFDSDLYRCSKQYSAWIRRYVEKRFSWDANLSGTLPVYEGLLNESCALAGNAK